MNQIIIKLFLGIGIITGFSGCSDNGKDANRDTIRPNIIYILADDLGYGELGVYGQKDIETPNIDQLAAEGMMFTDFYSGSPVCAPARCVFLTGLHSGKAQIRSNDEVAARGDVWDYHAALADQSLEGQAPLKAGTVTIGSLLQSVGYKTALVGKWGLGAPDSEGVPNKQGFDFFYGYNCQRQAHTYYPVHLWKNDQRVYLQNDTIAPHGALPDDADPYDLNSYEPYRLKDYSSSLMFDEITRFVEDNATNPFFLYWADPIPHLPLQAPQKWVDHYVEKFGDEEPYAGTKGRGGYFPVRYPRATYAAMISYLDENVGRLVQQLKDLGIYENTLIIFTSDNGPSGSTAAFFDGAAPFRSESGLVKGNLNEGGIRVPMIATWPDVIKPGSESNHIGSFQDMMPTFADVVDIEPPGHSTGLSLLPSLKGEKQDQPEFVYWEFPSYGGQMAVRMDNWKALRKEMHKGNLDWELYDLSKDPTEQVDVSESHPDLIEKVEDIVAREHTMSSNELFRFEVLGE